ncbi:GNAT family N-acetyltransferase [Phytohabitans sp. LJ34]|uniref:GNAT family N-acetyltransferase n=1 Tax=Phytohabitans sp. LJ34 TaxID=3452217 RepID=UPI003F8B1016
MRDTLSFERYLTSLVGSWQALAAPHDDAEVVLGDGFMAARFGGHPVLNNAVLLRPDALPAALAVFAGTVQYAIWSADEVTGAAVQAAGLRRDMTTVPMCCDLRIVPRPEDDGVLEGVAPEVIAELTEVDPALLRGVPGLWTFASKGFESGLVLIPVDTDVNVSFVTTRETARRRGLATTVLRHALAGARARGFVTASLQSTAMAQRLYAQAGFVPVGRWQEWVPTR